MSDEPLNVDPFSEEGAKPAEVKGAIEFKNILFAYPTRPNMKVGQTTNLSHTRRYG